MALWIKGSAPKYSDLNLTPEGKMRESTYMPWYVYTHACTHTQQKKHAHATHNTHTTHKIKIKYPI